MKTEFEVSFRKNGIHQARIIVAKSKDFAKRWFRLIEPKAVILGISENGDYKPGKPVEEVSDDWNGILFDDVIDNKFVCDDHIGCERTLCFNVPLEYLGEDYFDEETRSKAVSATISITYNTDYPTYEETAFDVFPTDADGHDFDSFRYEMSLEEYQMFMNIAKAFFRHTVNVTYVHGTDPDDPETGKTQFDLDDEDGEYSDVELFNLIIDFFKENHFIDPNVTGIWEA